MSVSAGVPPPPPPRVLRGPVPPAEPPPPGMGHDADGGGPPPPPRRTATVSPGAPLPMGGSAVGLPRPPAEWAGTGWEAEGGKGKRGPQGRGRGQR